MNESLREEIAAIQHEQWSGWLEYMFHEENATKGKDGAMTINPFMSARWKRQMETPYTGLTNQEQESDWIEADKIISIITRRETEAYERGVEAMKEALKKHFGISNPKIEGVSWTVNEIVDAVAKKLKGDV